MNVFDPKTFYNRTVSSIPGNDYENLRWGANQLLAAQYRMMEDVLKRCIAPYVRRAQRVLEAGPGPGTWTRVLLKASPNAQYTLVDISSNMLAQAKKNLAPYENVSFVENDLLMFEPSRPFDFFFSSRAIEYMPDKQMAVRKIASLLTRGAHGVIITKMPKTFFNWMRGRVPRAFHSAQIDSHALTQLLRSEGLIIDDIRIATATVPLIGSATFNIFVYRLLKHIRLFFPFTLCAESYFIIFHKPL